MAETSGEAYPEYRSQQEQSNTGPVDQNPAISFPIPDSILADVIDKREADTKAYYKEKLKLEERQQTNRNFWLGKQLDDSQFHEYQVPYKDNIIWQDLEHRITIAASRLPDIICTPPNNTPESVDSTRTLQKGLTIRFQSDAIKRLIKDGLRLLHLDLNAVVKCIWDKNKGPDGDYSFYLVNPKRILLEHNATIPHDGFTAQNIEIVWETLHEPLAVVAAKFPQSKEKLFKALGIIRGTSKQMMSKVKYQEVWVTWYDQQGKIYEGTAWKYGKEILGKDLHPYWDWEGYEQVTGEVGPEGVETVEQVYHNHLERPLKPYIVFSYQNLGEDPIESTTAVEQAIPLQRAINKRGRQITEIADRAIPKLAFAGAFITKEEARRITNDPDEHIWLKGAQDASKAVSALQSQPPAPMLYQDLVGNRMQIDSKFSTHGTTRGEAQPQESGVSKQITREGDLATSDDISSVVVERVIYEMANWAVQMMKVMYDKPHFVRDMGREGEMVEVELTRDSIEDGLAVNVKANSVDKAQRRSDAQALAARKAIDPLSLYEDMDFPNPKERTKRLVWFLNGAQDAYQRYLKEVGLLDNPTEETPAQGGQPGQPTQTLDAQQAAIDIQRMQAGEEFDPAGPPSEEYLSILVDYTESGDFDAQPPEVQEIFSRYVQKLRGTAEGTLGGEQAAQEPVEPQPQGEQAVV